MALRDGKGVEMISTIELGVDFDEEEVRKFLSRPSLEDERAMKVVRDIVVDVRRKGDEALFQYTRKFDGVDLKGNIAVKPEEIEKAHTLVDGSFIQAIRLSTDRIRSFHERQRTDSWFFTEKDGVLLGQLVRPIARVGIYVPGGLASYPSTVLMNAIPARVAGVEEVAMCVPPNSEGGINPGILVAAREAGVEEIYKVGGAQAVAALAYGTESIKKVDKITGPGNIYVTLAKKLVVGQVGIDMLAGPSEVVVLADEEADASFIAVDMLAQAEHAPDAMAVLVTTSAKVAEEVKSLLSRQLSEVKRWEVAKESLENNGRIFLLPSMKAALRLVNLIAPEHLELMVKKPLAMLEEVENAGAIFLGSYSPEAVGDYIAGPSHILPTSGTARFYSPLGVDDFIKRSSVLFYNEAGLKKVAEAVRIIAGVEGLEAHAKSLEKRLKGGRDRPSENKS